MTEDDKRLIALVEICPIGGDSSLRAVIPAIVFWNEATDSFAMVRRNLEGDPDPEFRLGDRFAQCSTFDALLGDLRQRGLRLANDQSAISLIDMASQVTDRYGPNEIVGWTTRDGQRRVGVFTPRGGWGPLQPAVNHRSHRLQWGDKSQNSLETAQLILDRSVGPALAASSDAYHLMVSVLADVGQEWSMTAQSIADWTLSGETPTTTLSKERVQMVKRCVLAVEQEPTPPTRGLTRD